MLETIAGKLISIGAAALIGTAAAWGVMKQKIASMEKRLDSMARNVVYRDTCAQCKTNQNDKYAHLAKLIEEVRNDVKDLLRGNGSK